MGGERQKHVEGRRASRWAQDGELAQSREAKLDPVESQRLHPQLGKTMNSLVGVQTHVTKPSNLLAWDLRQVDHELRESLVLVRRVVANVLEKSSQPAVVGAILQRRERKSASLLQLGSLAAYLILPSCSSVPLLVEP